MFGNIFVFSFASLAFITAGATMKAIEPKPIELNHSQFWSEDYAKALELSQATGKPLLLAFVGSDWCPWSQKMIKEIIGKSEFTSELQQQMVFVWVDFPEKLEISQEKKAQNKELRNRFSVQELPTLVLVDSSGEEIVKFGYLPFGPQEMANQLKNAICDFMNLKNIVGSPRLAGLKGDELENLYKKAAQLGRETEKKSLLEVGLKNDQGSFFLMQQYEQLIENAKLKDPSVQKLRRQIMAKDPSNHKGLHLQLALSEFTALSKKLKKKDNPEKAITPLVEYLRVYGPKDLQNIWRVEMIIAQFLFSKNRLEEAVTHAKMSYETAPTEYKSEVAQTLEYLASKTTKHG